MKIIDRTQNGNLVVAEETVLVTGTIIGDVHVHQGALLDFRGTLEGNLVVHRGAAVWLRGRVTGDAINRGGTLHISGSVGGTVNFETGLTMYFEGASVGGRRVLATGEVKAYEC